MTSTKRKRIRGYSKNPSAPAPASAPTGSSTEDGSQTPEDDNDTHPDSDCPVCRYIQLLPALYLCEKGHSICYTCRRTRQNCAVCKTPFRGSHRNLQIESAFRKYPCHYREEGCTQDELVAETFHSHHMNCFFRPQKCYFSGYEGCNGTLLHPSAYVKHLTQFHKMTTLAPAEDANSNAVLDDEDLPQRKFSVFQCNYTIQDWKKDTFMSSCDWADLLVLDGKIFVNHVFSRGNLLYFRLALIGDKNEAAKHRVKITIQKSSDGQLLKYEFTTMVISISELKNVLECQEEDLPYAVVPQNLFESFGEISDSSPAKFKWSARYEIESGRGKSFSSSTKLGFYLIGIILFLRYCVWDGLLDFYHYFFN